MLKPRRAWSWFLFIALASFTLNACSSDDQSPPQEPVGAQADNAANPDNSDATPDQDKDQPADAAKSDGGETVGTLTNEPFGAPKTPTADTAQPDAAAEAPSADDMTAPSPTTDSDAMQGAIEDQQQNYQPAPQAMPHVVKKKHHAHHKVAKHSHKKVVRYVKAAMLNIRSKPSLKGHVVGHLRGGDKVHVELHGAFAKLKQGQWVRSTYLSKPPRPSKHHQPIKQRQRTRRRQLATPLPSPDRSLRP